MPQQINGHDPFPISKFNGLFVRGRFDAVPPDHFSDTLNTQPSQDGWDTRDGFTQSSSTNAGVLRMYVFKVYGQADRILYLDSNGNIWDNSNQTTPILTIVGMTDFGFVNIFGRAYISPSNGITGLANQFLYVYTGSGLAVQAAGLAPSGPALVAVNSNNPGHIEAGTHLFAVVYETNTGFLTQPGPAIFGQVTAVGSQGVTLTQIPIGPANTVARRIIATKIIPSYNGNQSGYQFFFVPGGRIADNSTTGWTVSFFDAQLTNDASYLLNLYSQIPAGVHLGTYKGRLLSTGEAANPSVIRVSTAGQPEAIDQVNGLIIVDPANTSSGVVNTQEIRDILYIWKKTRTYSTFDPGANTSTVITPAFWDVITVDEGLGADVNSVAVILDTGGTNTNMVFVANQLGLCIFNGQYVLPEVSWKIRDLWKTINFAAFNTVDVKQDPVAQRVYIAVPFSGASNPNTILIMDYANANLNILSPFGLQSRWFKWTLGFPTTLPSCIAVISSIATGSNIFRVGGGPVFGNFFDLTPGLTNDAGFAIPTPFVQTGYVGPDDGIFYHCCGIIPRIVGNGNLIVTLYDYDKTNSSQCPVQVISATSSTKPYLWNNFIAQKFIVNVQVNNVNEVFKINSIDLYLKFAYAMLPV